MAISASWEPGSDADPRERNRRRRAFAAARRHSRFVRRMRVFLPAAGGLAVLVMVVAAHLSLPAGLDLSMARLSVTRNAVIMENPHLTGFDADGRDYTVEADRARQQLAAPDKVSLESIRARITTSDQGAATVTAAGGDYDNAASTLKLFGGIAVDSSEGYSLRLKNADIDLGAGSLVSPNPVTVRYQDSETTGRRLEVTGGGKSIVIEGEVRTRLMPPRRGAQGAPEPASEEGTQ